MRVLKNKEPANLASDLEKSEKRYHHLINEVTDYAIIALSVEGIVLDWNKGATRIKGYTPEEMIGKSFTLFYPEADREAGLPMRLLREAAKYGSAQHEGWRVRKDGSRFWGGIVISAIHDDDDVVIGFSKVTRDLTERKKYEDRLVQYSEEMEKANDQLRLSEERYHRMIAEIQDYAIILLDHDGIIQNWNTGAQFIKGYAAHEIVGKNFRIFYTPEDQAARLPDRLLDRAKITGKAIQEGWRIRKDGTKFWGSITITALHDASHNVIGFSKVTRDLTERKFAEDELKAKNAELEQMNKELSSFAYISSHDLQEPLRKIQTFTTRIREMEKGNLSPKGLDYFERIRASAHRMRTLIEDLLAYSQTNSAERKFDPTDLEKVLEDVRDELEPTIEEKNATVTWDHAPTAKVIRYQFHQLIFNLVSNALKFTRPGVAPQVRITSGFVARHEIPGAPNSIKPGLYHKLTVSDNGIGFEQEHAGKIFQIFQRLHTREEYAGTGVGLSICKKIAENHEGFIHAEGRVNEGASFHVYFPVSPEASSLATG